MKKKKGFTLIELLAVIVILGVIALIATPTVFYLIEKSRMEAFKDSVINSFSSLDYYLIQTKGKGTFESGIENGISIDELDLKDDFTKGSFVTTTNRFGSIPEGGVISYYIQNERYCSYGLKKDLKVAKKVNGNCFSLDETGPDFDGYEGKYQKFASSNRIALTFDDDFAIDLESGIIGYVIRLYQGSELVGEKGITASDLGTGKFSVSFGGLKSETTYTAKVEAENGNHVKTEQTLPDITTPAIINPSLAQEIIPNPAVNGYVKKQIIYVTYSSENVENPIYYIKTTRKGNSNINVEAACGEATMPEECTSTSTQELTANTWYKVSGNINVTYEEDTNENAYVYTYTSDGNNYKGGATFALFKVDNIAPTLELGIATTTSNSAIIPIQTFTDFGVGIDKITSCRYGETNGTYSRSGTINGTNNCSLRGLTKNKTYYYQVCGQDKLGNSTCKTGNTASKDIINPSVIITSTPGSSINGYVKSQVANITFNSSNVTSPVYYIKTGRAGTSSVPVTESYGQGTMPESPDRKTNIASTTQLVANTWYKVSGNMTITYTGNAIDNPTVYAMIFDGNNYSGAGTGTLAKLDNTGPGIVLENGTSSTNSATVNIKAFSDSGAGIDRITSCKYGTSNGSYTTNGSLNGNSSCRLNNLDANKTYYYQVCGQDRLGNSSCKTGNTATKKPVNPIITYTNTPASTINGYLKKQVAHVKFDRTNIDTPIYYVKTTISGSTSYIASASSSTVLLESCGTANSPSTCSAVSDKQNLQSNVWYKVSGNIDVIYTNGTNSNATIIAMVSDGKNTANSGTGTIAKIDTFVPSISLGSASTTSDKIVVPITSFTDGQSGVDRITSCKTSTNRSGTISGNSSCTFTGLNQNTTYYYTVCGQDRLGNSRCVSSSATTKKIINPKITLSSNPSSSIGGFVDRQTATVTFYSTNVTSPTYYIKSGKPGTLNVNTTGICGTGTTPGSCSSSSTRSLSEGYWYRVNSSTVQISYTEGYYNSSLPTLYAMTGNGASYSSGTSASLTNVFYLATQVTYTNHGQSTVQGALDDLYKKYKDSQSSGGSNTSQSTGGNTGSGNTGGSNTSQAG